VPARCQTDVVNDAFEEVALILGGFLAQVTVRDQAAWTLAGEVSGSWFRAIGRSQGLGGRPVDGAPSPLHPSVRAMLAAIRCGAEGAAP
jgi:hypothetical protein